LGATAVVVVATTTTAKKKHRTVPKHLLKKLTAQEKLLRATLKTDDFPHPYAYEDVLKVARILMPLQVTSEPPPKEGGAFDVGIIHSERALYGQLEANLQSIEKSKSPKWVKSTNLFYGVIWPFFASGLGGGRWMQKGEPTPSSTQRAKKLGALALYSFAWMLGPITVVVPKNRSLLEALTDPNFPGLSLGSFKKPTLEEQTKALTDLHGYLRDWGPKILALDTEKWLDHQQKGLSRLSKILDEYFLGSTGGHASSPEMQYEGNMKIIEECIRFSLESAYIENLQVEREVLDWQWDQSEVERGFAYAFAIAVAAAVVVITGVAAGAAMAGAVAKVGAIVSSASSMITTAITDASVAVLGAKLGASFAAKIIVAAQLAVITGVGAALKELGMAALAKDLGIETSLSPEDQAKIDNLTNQAIQEAKSEGNQLVVQAMQAVK
jgi:hypothetical protein